MVPFTEAKENSKASKNRTLVEISFNLLGMGLEILDILTKIYIGQEDCDTHQLYNTDTLHCQNSTLGVTHNIPLAFIALPHCKIDLIISGEIRIEVTDPNSVLTT